MSALSPARRFALKILLDAAHNGRYARDVHAAAPDRPRDARDDAFALVLALGVTATSGVLDEALDAWVRRPRDLAPAVRQALRISAYELLYLDTAPEVVVSQGVELVRARAPRAAGLANAVLRRVAEQRDAFLNPAHDPALAGARRAGLPLWLSQAVEESLGSARAQAFRDAELTAPPLAAQVHPRADVTAPSGTVIFPGCIAPVEDAAPTLGEAARRADIAISDLHAQLIACAATRPGSLLEVGCGRGTKTYTMACQARRRGWLRRHVALDLSPERIAENAHRLEAAGMQDGITLLVGDGCSLDEALTSIEDVAGSARFATVLVDAPCSGTGTMRRHPEIPWRLDDRSARTTLPDLQFQLLCAAASRVEEGGEVLYATCSVLTCENEDVVDRFLASDAGRGFELKPFSAAPLFQEDGYEGARELARAGETASGAFQSAPAPGGFDGHFCARLRRAC